MNDAKSAFEQNIQDFCNLKTLTQNEGCIEIEKLHNEHRKELERLRSAVEENQQNFTKEKKELHGLFNKQVNVIFM